MAFVFPPHIEDHHNSTIKWIKSIITNFIIAVKVPLRKDFRVEIIMIYYRIHMSLKQISSTLFIGNIITVAKYVKNIGFNVGKSIIMNYDGAR